MMRNKNIITEIIINAPKETVWDILIDFGQYPKWNPFIVKVEGDLKVGKKFKNTVLHGDKPMIFKYQVLKVIPFQYFDWLGSLFIKGIFDGHHFFEIEEIIPGLTRLIHGGYFSGILSMVIFKKIGPDTRAGFIRMNQAIKGRAEKNSI